MSAAPDRDIEEIRAWLDSWYAGDRLDGCTVSSVVTKACILRAALDAAERENERLRAIAHELSEALRPFLGDPSWRAADSPDNWYQIRVNADAFGRAKDARAALASAPPAENAP